MAINFPATPTLNQTYTYNGRTWTYNNVGWQATGSTGLTVYTKTNFTATAAQTTFSVTYTVGFVDVYYNGSKLSSSEYTATTGSTVVLGTACSVNDIVETIAWTISSSFNPSLGSASATSLAIGGATIGSNALAVTGTTALSGLLTAAGGVSSTLTTDATSTTTGSIITAGGISTQKALFVGTTSNFAGTMTAAAANFSGLITGSAKAVINPAATPTTAATATQLGVGEATNNSSYRLNLGYWVDSGVYRGNIDAITGGTAATLTLNSTGGLVGIGMTPSNVLDVAQSVNTLATLSIKNVNAGTSAGARIQATNGTYTALFDMEGTGYASSGVFRQNGCLIYADGPGGITIDTGVAQPIYFAINNTEKARFDTSGNLLINSTATGGPTTVSKLVVTNSNTNVAYLDDTDAGTSDSLIIRKASTAGTLARFYYTSTSVGTITTNGTTTTYGTSSDYRLKENVQPMTGGLATVAALKPVTYDWIIDKSAGEGFIAHELQVVIPAAVTGEKDALDKDGSIKPQGVDFGKIVPHLVAAMQEQQATIQELTTRLAALEAK